MSVRGGSSRHEQRGAGFHRDRDRRRLRAMARAVGCTAVAVALVLGVVAVKVQQVRLSYRLDGLRTAAGELEDRRTRLLVEQASLRSLARVEEKARELGFVRPQREQVQLAREFVVGSDAVAALGAARRLSAERAGR